jgi:N-acetylmuramoyl-L-alanine amidase
MLAFLLAVTILFIHGEDCQGAPSAKQKYIEAERCYKALRHVPRLQKYRDQWFACIEKFNDVYQREPDGPWAAAGLFQSGMLHLELAKRSFLQSDRQAAAAIFEQIEKRYPKSRYHTKANKQLTQLAAQKPVKTDPRPETLEAKRLFQSAQETWRYLESHPKLQKYRDRWFACIDKFNDVYRHDPHGPWAAAGLYQSGMLHLELAKRSFLQSDRQAAAAIFKQIEKHFPKSLYHTRAQKQLARIAAQKPFKTDPRPETLEAERLYKEAQKDWRYLESHSKLQKYRDRWLRCIDKFHAAYQRDPHGPHAAAALYMTAELYTGLYRKSFRGSDNAKAKAAYEEVIERFGETPYREKAQNALGIGDPLPKDRQAAASDTRQTATVELTPEEQKQAALDHIAKIIAEQAAQENRSAHAASPDGPATVQGLRYWTNPSYTRIVIDADQETGFEHRLLRKDLKNNKPQRLYIDLERSRLAKDIDKHVPINDDLLLDARAGQYTNDTVRVVVDIKSFKTYKIFSLRNPYRIVVDVWGLDDPSQMGRIVSNGSAENGSKLPTGALAKQLALGVRRIVIDPGHGGHDYGAPGYIKGVFEKDIVLQIAKRLAKKIVQQLGCEVIMTRTSDRYLTLEERTALANTKNADLFVSIHTNAARNRRAYGMETYFLNLATDDEAILVAARENATSTKNISDLQSILNDLMQNAKINESSRLATYVQDTMYSHIQKSYSTIKSKGVKQAPFYVLMGAQMPAVLVETSFISNPRECKRLTDSRYQDRLCDGIVSGIQRYIEDINPTAFYQSPPQNRNRG